MGQKVNLNLKGKTAKSNEVRETAQHLRAPTARAEESQHQHGRAQTSVTPGPGDLTPAFGLCLHQEHEWYIDRHADKTDLDIKR